MNYALLKYILVLVLVNHNNTIVRAASDDWQVFQAAHASN